MFNEHKADDGPKMHEIKIYHSLVNMTALIEVGFLL